LIPNCKTLYLIYVIFVEKLGKLYIYIYVMICHDL
jgi:hypothetical protein